MPEDMADEVSMKRRMLLRKTAATGSVITGASAFAGQSVGAAQVKNYNSIRERELFRTEFGTPEKARDAINKYASEVLEELARKGFISDATPEALPTDGIAEYSTDVTEGMKIFAARSHLNMSSDQITVFKETDRGKVRLSVRPHIDHAHAVVKFGDSIELIDPSGEIEPKECRTVTECDCISCPAGGYQEIERECCFSGGYIVDCTYIGTDCGCATC